MSVGILGLYLAGKKRATGWAIGLGAQVLWVFYAFATQQWGFVVSAVVYGVIYAKNWLDWRNESGLVVSSKPPLD